MAQGGDFESLIVINCRSTSTGVQKSGTLASWTRGVQGSWKEAKYLRRGSPKESGGNAAIIPRSFEFPEVLLRKKITAMTKDHRQLQHQLRRHSSADKVRKPYRGLPFISISPALFVECIKVCANTLPHAASQSSLLGKGMSVKRSGAAA